MWLLSVFKLVLYSTVLGSIVALFILMLKLLIRDKLGVRWNYWVWLLLVIRLLIPYAPQSSLSVFNILNFNKSTVSQINILSDSSFFKKTSDFNKIEPLITSPQATKTEELKTNINSQIGDSKIVSPKKTVDLTAFFFEVMADIWLAGIIILVVFNVLKTMIFFSQVSKTKIG